LYEALKKREIEVVIHDLPILEYYIKTHPQERFRVIGDVFQAEKYAFLMPNDSPLKEELNRALLQMYSDGSYQSIFQSYFQ
jgi:ABC-type amino acid transport substrate-binding protein